MPKYNNLVDSILTISEITCSKCNKTSVIQNCDQYDAVQAFERDGWKQPREHVYCPKCAKKHLKSKK